MKARRDVSPELESSAVEGSSEEILPVAGRVAEASENIEDATEVADEMAAKSAVLVEMMEDLEERLRQRMANLSDPAPVYTRKVRRFRQHDRHRTETSDDFTSNLDSSREPSGSSPSLD